VTARLHAVAAAPDPLPVRLMVVDDHAVVRAGLEQLLTATAVIQVVAVAASGEEAIRLAASARPDVTLMDLSMPGIDGVEATRAITAAQPEARIVVLTSFSDRERILDAFEAGAIGYLIKDAEPTEIVEAVEAAARGESPLAQKAATELVRAQRGRAPADKLSERELDVLALIAEGRPNKAIASRLGITERTVKAHLTRIYRRIGADDRTQAALWARRHGMGAGPEATG
jgi:DNA-binding NarL/FixJ family response regulator